MAAPCICTALRSSRALWSDLLHFKAELCSDPSVASYQLDVGAQDP